MGTFSEGDNNKKKCFTTEKGISSKGKNSFPKGVDAWLGVQKSQIGSHKFINSLRSIPTFEVYGGLAREKGYVCILVKEVNP